MYTQGFMGWGYMRLCCHLVGSRSLIDFKLSPWLCVRSIKYLSNRILLTKRVRYGKSSLLCKCILSNLSTHHYITYHAIKYESTEHIKYLSMH